SPERGGSVSASASVIPLTPGPSPPSTGERGARRRAFPLPRTGRGGKFGGAPRLHARRPLPAATGATMITENLEGLGRALFQEAGDGLFLFDPDDDQLLDVNPTAERLTGHTRDELLRRPATYWFRFAGPNGSKDRLRQAASRTGVFHAQDGF